MNLSVIPMRTVQTKIAKVKTETSVFKPLKKSAVSLCSSCLITKFLMLIPWRISARYNNFFNLISKGNEDSARWKWINLLWKIPSRLRTLGRAWDSATLRTNIFFILTNAHFLSFPIVWCILNHNSLIKRSQSSVPFHYIRTHTEGHIKQLFCLIILNGFF